MRRPLLPRMLVPPTLERPVLLQPEAWLAFVTVWGLTVNEWIGPPFLALALMLWSAYCLRDMGFLYRSLTVAGLVPWLMPLLALSSALWSPVPALTVRSAIQLGVTVALALMTARVVTPRRFVTCLWVAMGIIMVLSVFFNKPYYDGMTGRTTMAGVFNNKNTLSICSASFALASAAICLDHGRTGLFRIIAFVGIGVGATLNLLARSVGVISAMVLAIAMLGVIVFARSWPRRLRTPYIDMAILGGLSAGTLLLMGILALREELLALVGKDSTLTGRTTLWFYAERLSQDFLPLGTGYQAFWLQGFPPAEHLWKAMHIASRQGFHFHSLYYETLIQLGYAGVVVGTILVSYCISIITAWVRRSPDVVSGFCAAYLIMILVTQWQAIGIFSQFDLNCFFLMVSVAYAANWRSQQAGLRRIRLPQAPLFPYRSRTNAALRP